MENTPKIITYGDPSALGVIECPYCTAPLEAPAQGTARCKHCGNLWTVPKQDATPETLYFLRIGEHDLDTGKFDDAFEAYKKAAELDPKEPEAYFGMALAEFKVQYIKDLVNGRVQPICHERTEKTFSDSTYFLKAIRYATNEQRTEYEKKGEEIDYIQSAFRALEASGKDYDCFLCVKVSDGDRKTEDSKNADYIYNLLQNKGYKPFYSERELRNVTGADYEARILYALYTSECMLVVCRNEEYLQTPWVKNEYTRFLKLVNDEEKTSDSITIVFHTSPIERLPGRKGKLQGIDFALREADGQIVDFVEQHTPEARAKREAEERSRLLEKERRAEQDEAIRRQIEEQKKAIENLQTTSGRDGDSVTVGNLLARAKQFEKDVEFSKAIEYYDRVLDAQPDNSEAKAGFDRLKIVRYSKIESKKLLKYTGNAEEVVIPDGITAIGELAFENCNTMKSIAIPASVTRIGGAAFDGCTGLQKVVISDLAAWCRIYFEEHITQAHKYAASPLFYAQHLYLHDQELTAIEFPADVKKIPNYAFINCVEIQTIKIPDDVTEIGHRAFSGCCKLANVSFPDSLTSIGDSAFWGCEMLTKVMIPNQVSTIGYNAFSRCKALEEVILTFIPNRSLFDSIFTTPIAYIDAFTECRSLQKVTMPKKLKRYRRSIFGFKIIAYTYTK